jgi:hypothetical protein
MSLGKTINALLSRFNFAIVRRNTLDSITASGNVARYMQDLQKELLRHQIATKWEVVDFTMRATAHEGENRRCPLCGHAGTDDTFAKFESHCIFGGGTLLRHQCPACDVIFGADKMFQLSSAELTHDYEWHYKVYEEGDSTELELRAFYCLHPSREGTYLNYGAGGWSRSVQILRDEGWNVMAFEPHGSASSGADYVISSQSALSAMKFDGIFSNNVLEHLRQPVSELSFMRSLLKPGGLMSHATPCFDYLYEFTRFHLFFYIGKSRTVLAQEANLSIKEFVADGEFMCCVLEPTES